MDAYEKLFVRREAERQLHEKMENELKPLDEKEDNRKPADDTQDLKKAFVRVEPEKKLLTKMKVLKLSKNVTTGMGISERHLKEDSSGNPILIVDDILEENDTPEDILTMIKAAGIEYIIAPGFAEVLHEKVANLGLRLIRCSESKCIEEGNDIDVHLSEGIIFDLDTEQEYKINPEPDCNKKNIMKTMEAGESLIISDDTNITVVTIDRKQIQLCVNASKVVTLGIRESKSISDDIKIHVVTIDMYRVDLGIEAPEYVTRSKRWRL